MTMTAAGFYSEVILRSSLKILSEDVISEVISLVENPGLCVKHPTGSALPLLIFSLFFFFFSIKIRHFFSIYTTVTME